MNPSRATHPVKRRVQAIADSVPKELLQLAAQNQFSITAAIRAQAAVDGVDAHAAALSQIRSQPDQARSASGEVHVARLVDSVGAESTDDRVGTSSVTDTDRTA